jgi:hypothetical protein
MTKKERPNVCAIAVASARGGNVRPKPTNRELRSTLGERVPSDKGFADKKRGSTGRRAGEPSSRWGTIGGPMRGES